MEQLMSRRSTQAGNRASQSGRSLQRWDRPSECMGLFSGKTKLHDCTTCFTDCVLSMGANAMVATANGTLPPPQPPPARKPQPESMHWPHAFHSWARRLWRKHTMTRFNIGDTHSHAGMRDSAKKNVIHFSICACHPCAGAMLIFSVSFQF